MSLSFCVMRLSSVPVVFEREARIKFFVTFECTFKRWCVRVISL